MFTELLAAAKAIPRIVDALERLGDLGTAIAAQQRKDEKDKMLIDLIALARERRLREREAQRLSGDSGSSSERLGDGGGI